MIENIYLTDNDEHYAPPEQPVLEIGLSGDIAFLSIGKWDARTDERQFTTAEGQQVAVSVTDLVNALRIMNIGQAREDAKRVLPGGDRDLRAANL